MGPQKKKAASKWTSLWIVFTSPVRRQEGSSTHFSALVYLPLRGTLCTHLFCDNVALLIRELFLSHLFPWNILKLILLELERGKELKIDK